MYVYLVPMGNAFVICLALLGTGSPIALAQMMPAPAAGASNRAISLPMSGAASQGSVEATQSAAPAGGVDTLSSRFQVGGNYAGSVPAANFPAGPITLTLADAVKLGLRANLGSISADNASRAARAARLQALSAMLPDIGLSASETVTQVDLAAYGFQFKAPPGFPISIPTVVGPFSYSQLQGSLSTPIFDLVSRRNWQAAKESERASILSAKDTRELVVLAVAGSYLQTIATASRIASQRAQVENAQAVYNQAAVRKSAGTNSRIDVTRSLVELETEQQRLTSLESDLRKQKIALARTIGLPLDRDLLLSETLGFSETALPDAETAIRQAFQSRADLRSADAQVQAAERALSAAHAERLPSASVSGDYGVMGPNPTNTHGVFAVTGSINVPVWQGGRIKGDIQQAEATLHQRQAELADLRGRVEQDVRTALIDLETAQGQVKLAQNNRKYANETLAEARDRFGAGVGTTLEVVQAEEQVASAETDYVSSLYSFNLAKLALARATGGVETQMPGLLKGNRP
ncbi:MAG TPA: TolC family protein [Bryobacteraceae bacterium]|nr:TolC family protein [Bryobacteraceae bacterium]